MGFYIRALAEFPEVFAWLKERGWRKKNRLATIVQELNLQTSFPDFAAKLDDKVQSDEERGVVVRQWRAYNPIQTFRRLTRP